MSLFKTMLFFTGCFIVSVSQASYVTYTTGSQAEKFDRQLLESQYYNECLLTCTHSEDPDCPENCRALAKDKAKEVESRR